MKKYHRNILTRFSKLSDFLNSINLLYLTEWRSNDIVCSIFDDHPSLLQIKLLNDKVLEWLYSDYYEDCAKAVDREEDSDDSKDNNLVESVKYYLDLLSCSKVIDAEGLWEEHCNTRIKEVRRSIVTSSGKNLSGLITNEEIESLIYELTEGKYTNNKDYTKYLELKRKDYIKN